MLILDVIEWGNPPSIITAAHDGSCYVFTYENTAVHSKKVIVDLIVDDHRVSVFLTNGDIPDFFAVDAPPGFIVTESLDVEEDTTGTILSCPILLG